jgi:hypothetical protein
MPEFGAERLGREQLTSSLGQISAVTTGSG